MRSFFGRGQQQSAPPSPRTRRGDSDATNFPPFCPFSKTFLPNQPSRQMPSCTCRNNRMGSSSAPCSPGRHAEFLKDSAESHSLCDESHGLHVDNSSTILEKMKNLFVEKDLSDVIFIVGEKTFPVHRLVLSFSSDVFRIMLMNPNWCESHEQKIVLQEEPSCVNVFQDFLQYLYIGTMCIDHTQVLSILMLADKYNVPDLIHLCVNYMCLHIVSATKHNQIVSWLQYALACGHAYVATACKNFILWNFQRVSETKDFANMEKDVLIDFLKRSELVIYDELCLYKCIAVWLELQEQRSVDNFESLVSEVMSFIRFPMMSPRQLAELLLYPLTIRFKDFFVEKMALAMVFHSTSDGSKATAKCEDMLLKPRVYTNDAWCAALAIENFRSLSSYSVRTLVFSSPLSPWEKDVDKVFDWNVDLYPKGVWFKKCLLIVWHGTIEVPESVYKTVRLSVMSKSLDVIHVEISILISGMEDGEEHIRSVSHKRWVFHEENRMLNIDDLLPFSELNERPDSPYLIGLAQDIFKVQIVIKPLII